MTQSAAMVFSKVVKGAGFGAKVAAECDAVLASFEPPVEFGPHSEMQGSKRGHQAEHGGAVASAFHRRGRKGPKMPGCGNYDTSSALTWMVHDKQRVSTEHKMLTDAMRKFSQSNDLNKRQATVKEWLEEYKKAAKDVLRKRMEKAGQKVDEDKLEKAAECIRMAFEADLKKADASGSKPIGIAMDTKLRNPWKATKEMRAARKAIVRSRGGGAP